MSQVIPAEAIEAAAKAAALADNFTELDWNMVPRRYTQRYYNFARAALEAAAPHIRAEAWDEGHHYGTRGQIRYQEDSDENPYRPPMSEGNNEVKYTIKAAALSRAHLGERVTINRGELKITDTLSGVSHEADLISERKMSEEVFSYVLGRTETNLTFANAGRVQVAGNDDVTVEGKP